MITETARTSEDSYDYIAYDITADGVTVGTAAVMADARTAYCERIDIDPEFRNRGHGTAALRDLSDLHSGLIIAPDNPDAARLYRRIGTVSTESIYDQGYGVYEI